MLYYNTSRYYDPEIGRWISPDDISYLDPSSINGLNLYCYCKNNPIMMVDSSGYWPDWNGFGKWIGQNASTILKTTASVALIAGGTILCATGIGAPLGAALIVVGAGGLIGGAVGHLSGAGFDSGWNIGSAIGLAIGGAILAAPLIAGFAGTSFTFGGGALAFAGVGGSAAITVTGGQILAAGLIGATIMLARTSRSNGYWGENWSGDHSPEHFHLKGEDGTNIRIGIDGNPLDRNIKLSSQQRKALEKLWKEIMKRLFKIG